LPLSPTTYVEGSSDIAAGNFVLQKRALTSSSTTKREADDDEPLDLAHGSKVSLREAKPAVVIGIEGKVKKSKLKRIETPTSRRKLCTTDTITIEKKKRKKKELLGSEVGPEDDNIQKPPTDGKMTGKHKGKSTLFTMTGLCDGEIELPHLLRDLHALALNPFHCAIQMIQSFHNDFNYGVRV
ncbi:hypothetical protein LINPERPRIM_LOCUS30466, partial [Linum perenne]